MTILRRSNNRSFLKSWHAVRQFRKLPRDAKRLVFYSEGKAYWPHLGPLIRAIVDHYDIPLIYVSSSPDDPGLTFRPDKIKSYCVGSGICCTLWFMWLDADVLVMTMPDLGIFHIKRSKASKVHYVYVQHAPVSSHMMYRERAFDNYDTIFLAGPHHKIEIMCREKLLGLKSKQLFEHGYSRMDDLLKDKKSCVAEDMNGGKIGPVKVLIAPGWGDNGILCSCGYELVRVLLKSGFNIELCPHPQSYKKNSDVILAYVSEFGKDKNFKLDGDASSAESLMRADVLITDWSGVAYDYAFSRKRPVLFIDTPRKIKNLNYEKLSIEPMEVAIREEIGEVLKPESLNNVPDLIRDLIRCRTKYIEHCERALNKWIYNIGVSASVGAAELVRITNNLRDVNYEKQKKQYSRD